VKVLLPRSGKISFFLARRRQVGGAKGAASQRRRNALGAAADDGDRRVVSARNPDVLGRPTYDNTVRSASIRIALYSPAAAIDLQTSAPCPIPR